MTDEGAQQGRLASAPRRRDDYGRPAFRARQRHHLTEDARLARIQAQFSTGADRQGRGQHRFPIRPLHDGLVQEPLQAAGKRRRGGQPNQKEEDTTTPQQAGRDRQGIGGEVGTRLEHDGIQFAAEPVCRLRRLHPGHPRRYPTAEPGYTVPAVQPLKPGQGPCPGRRGVRQCDQATWKGGLRARKWHRIR
jgi:hypothetical protein